MDRYFQGFVPYGHIRKEYDLTIGQIFSKEFLIHAFGGEMDAIITECTKPCKVHDGLLPDRYGHWHGSARYQGHKLLETYIDNGIDGLEKLLIELLKNNKSK